MNTQQILVSHARKIAVYRGYADLVDGLQPADRLEAKLLHEREELQEAQAAKSRLHAYHEAADVLYYAACLQEQGKAGQFAESCAWLVGCGLDPAKAERAALAKYQWRAGGPNRKDEAYELRLLVPVLYRLVIFDLNGTLANTPFLDHEPLHLLPGRKQACEQLRMDETIHTLVASRNRGRYALDEPDGPDLTAGEVVAVWLGGHWTLGQVEHGGRLYAVERTGQSERGYYFLAADGSCCGLCSGRRARLL